MQNYCIYIYMYNFSTVMAVFIAFVCVYFHFSLKILQLNRMLDPRVEMFGGSECTATTKQLISLVNLISLY